MRTLLRWLVVVAVLAGIATAWRIGFPFSSLWIIWGLVGFVLSGALLGFIGNLHQDSGRGRDGRRLETKDWDVCHTYPCGWG